MTDNKYNGWTNYATWRINFEIFDGYDPEGQEIDHEYCKDFAEGIVCGENEHGFRFKPAPDSLCVSYAMAFMSDVNWHEIADHINEELKEGNENE